MEGHWIKVLGFKKMDDDQACAQMCRNTTDCSIYAYGPKEFIMHHWNTTGLKGTKKEIDEEEAHDNERSSPFRKFCHGNTSTWNCINWLSCFWCTIAKVDYKEEHREW